MYRWNCCLSLFCTYECHSRSSSWCKRNSHGNPPAQDGSLNPYTLVAAAELGLEEIYKMGGAQAVFALAWGTDTVPKVDLISGREIFM